MVKLTEEQRKNHNRTITILVFGMLIASWVMINANEFLLPAFLYIVLGIISVFLYFVWNKF